MGSESAETVVKCVVCDINQPTSTNKQRDGFIALLNNADADQSGSLSLKEFISIVRVNGHLSELAFSDRSLTACFKGIDLNNSGNISLNEFVIWLQQSDISSTPASPNNQRSGPRKRAGKESLISTNEKRMESSDHTIPLLNLANVAL